MKEVRFPSMLSMDYPGLVCEALARVREELPPGETLTVDLTELQKISAFGVAALGACLARLVASKRLPSGSVIRRPESGRVSNDLMRMGLYRLLQEASVNVYTGQKMASRPQELWLVERPQDLETAIPRLVNLLRGVLPASKADFERVMEIFSALGDNAFRHGAVQSGVLLCGQAFPKNGVVELAVADTGRGMASSLKRLPSLEGLNDDATAILAALGMKVKVQGGPPRLGLLNTLLATARKNNGEMTVLSGDAALSFRAGALKGQKVSPYAGTVVGLRLRLLSSAAPASEAPPADTPAAAA